MATTEDFEKIDMRVGKIVKVEDYPEAKKHPSYKMEVDFGEEIGLKKCIGGYATNYSKEDMLNKLVLCVVNFPPRQIGSAISEVLMLGIEDENGKAILIEPEKPVELGVRMY